MNLIKDIQNNTQNTEVKKEPVYLTKEQSESSQPKEESEDSINVNAVQIFFESRDLTHYWHLQTTSYATHTALGAYYNSIVGLSDTFIEVLQGISGNRATGKISIQLVDFTEEKCNNHFKKLKEDIDTLYTQVQDFSELLNILDEIKALINKTIYLLTLK